MRSLLYSLFIPTILLAAVPVPLIYADTKPEIKVLDKDDMSPVAAEVHYLPWSGKPAVIGHSDAITGEAPLDTVPKNGERLYVRPDPGKPHLNKSFQWPPPSFIVTVERPIHGQPSYLVLNLNAVRSQDEPAKVALIANELSQTEAGIPAERSAYELETYEAFAKSISVPMQQATIFDVKQKKNVPSDTLVSAIKEFQKDKGLKATGNLDYVTLRAKAGADIHAYKFSAPTTENSNARPTP